MKPFLLLIAFFAILSAGVQAKEAIIIDHTKVNLGNIPAEWIVKAQQQLSIYYGHTSHGSQVVSGMNMLAARDNSPYKWGAAEALPFIDDYSIDLGSAEWVQYTRNALNAEGSNINLVMWSWCGQVSWMSDAEIDNYLSQMNQLETDYPNVKFIYFTGHLDGSGASGTLHHNNERIREYCRANGKILFDFADIESYGPDGTPYLELNADDGCNYQNGQSTANWATEWCSLHPDDCVDCQHSDGCAHSECLNCLRKGMAIWYGYARIAGWDGTVTSVIEEDTAESEGVMLFQNYPNPAETFTQFKFYVPDQRAVTFVIYNSNGDEVLKPVENKMYSKGEHSTDPISIKDLPSGHYEYLLKAGSVRISKTMIVVR